MWIFRPSKWRERKVAKSEIKQAGNLINKWGEELAKLNPADIRADRIKSEMNRLRGLYNSRIIRLQENNIELLYFLLGVLFIGIIFSFFAKPKFNISITVSAIIGLSIATSGIILMVLRHFLTKNEREAKVRRDNEEANYFRHLISEGKKE
ncbi:hypothetical protein HYY69_01150 [Candidatus Woesearchaeota archaeon]|nr:hypothetical protein [Candidatus Woesearchaeota archaeon]